MGFWTLGIWRGYLLLNVSSFGLHMSVFLFRFENFRLEKGALSSTSRLLFFLHLRRMDVR